MGFLFSQMGSKNHKYTSMVVKSANLFAAMSLSILANNEQYDRFHHCRCRKKVMRSKLKMSIFIGWKNS